MDRRSFLIGSAVSAALAPYAARAMIFPHGGVSPGGSGFYPSGHWLAALQSMIQIYPRPDTETPTWARHRWAYWDGTNDIEYSVPIGVAFGAYPYVFELLSGPPGMYIGETIYNGFQNSSYGRVIWHPQGNISSSWSGTVQVKVTDQSGSSITISWSLATATSNFVFIDSSRGSDSNNGAYATPYASIAGAFGSTYSTTKNANALCYIATGTGNYTFPVYTDNTYNTSWALFEFNTATKPSALMAIPGDAPTFDMTSSLTCGAGSDLFVQGIALSGYVANAVQVRGFWFYDSRVTFDGVSWANPGIGTTGGENDTLFYADAGAAPFPEYLFITDCSETGRTNSLVATNYAGCVIYSYTNALVQRCSSTSSGQVEGAWYAKSDTQNCSLRENFASHTNAAHAFSFGQAPNSNTLNSECVHNIGINIGGIFLPQTGGYTYGTLRAGRNSIIGSSGMASNEATSSGPYIFDSNAVQTSASPQPPTGSSIQSDGLNQVAASGLLNTTTGLLVSNTYLGTVGAQIA